jgi:spermidine synthase
LSRYGSISARLLVCFFLSGAAALVYQILWVRWFLPVLGNTIVSASLVVSAFMAGLALGSRWVGARLARKPVANPARAYAAFELGIGLSAVALPFAILACEHLLAALHGQHPPAWIVAAAHVTIPFVLLIGPCALMGGTFPIATQVLRAGGAASAARLYAWNTVGAAAGAAAAGFVLLPALGNARTCAVAVAVSLGVAALMWLSPGGDPADDSRRLPEEDATPQSRAVWNAALAALFLSGFAGLVYEIAWTRVFSLVFGPITYMFSAILVSFILASGAGAAIGSRLLARIRAPLGALGAVSAATAATALAVTAAIPLLPRLAARLGSEFRAEPGRLFALEGLVVFALVAVPAVFMGLGFPLACRAALRSEPELARRAGLLYAANTLGSILGAAAAGLLLLPRLGAHGTLGIAAAVNGATAVCLWFLREKGSGKWVLVSAGLLLAAVVPGARPWSMIELTAGAYKYAPYWPAALDPEVLLTRGKLLYVREGLHGVVAVRDSAARRMLTIQGKIDASDRGDMAAQLLLGHLPLIQAPQPRRVAVIGLGSGVTLAAVLKHPVREVDVVEISPEVVEASRYFEHVNDRALDDPRVRVTIDDGRRFLRYGRGGYDVIVSEPSNPWMSGLALLFTSEFFAIARDRLSPGGLFCQWLQTYNLGEQEFRSILATFADVFPHAWVWAASDLDVMLIGGSSPRLASAGAVESGLREPGVAHQLAAVGFTEPRLIWFLYMNDRAAMNVIAGGAALHTDDLPFLEYAGASMLHANTSAANFRMLLERRKAPPHVGWRPLSAAELPHLLQAIGSFYERAENDGQAFEAYRRALAVERTDATYAALLRTATTPAARAQLETMLQANAAMDGRAAYALARLHLESDPRRALLDLDRAPADGSGDAFELRAQALLRLGRADEALASARRAAEQRPGDAAAWTVLASALLAHGAPAEAKSAAEHALALEPANPRALAVSATASAARGDNAEAERLLRAAVDGEARSAQLRLNLAQFLLRTNRVAESEEQFRAALDLEPMNPRCLAGMGDWYKARGDAARADMWYRRAEALGRGSKLQ